MGFYGHQGQALQLPRSTSPCMSLHESHATLLLREILEKGVGGRPEPSLLQLVSE